MWQNELSKELVALAEKYGLVMVAFAGTVKNSEEALVMAGGEYDQLVYGLHGIIQKISKDGAMLAEDVIADLDEITDERRG